MDFNLNNCLKTSLNWLIPQYCIVCKQQLTNTHTSLAPQQCCESCHIKLPFLGPACQQCGQAITEHLDYCGQCLINPPIYDHCFCPFRYETPIDALIQQLKYKEKPEVAKLIANLFHQELINHDIPLPELLVPVPMHLNRLRQRGYNQALLISKHLSRLLAIPYDNQFVHKLNHTQAQAGLSFDKRKSNLKGAFSVTQFAPNNTHIAIIDDVITTGSTVAEITKTLKQNGVHCVSVWGVAHTIQ